MDLNIIRILDLHITAVISIENYMAKREMANASLELRWVQKLIIYMRLRFGQFYDCIHRK